MDENIKQYIDKSALVAEIERRKSELQSKIVELGTFESNTLGLFQEVDLYDDILSFIDTLEVKETYLKKDFELTWEDVAWIVNKVILKCKVEGILTAEDICKDALKQFKAQKEK